jgi:hypothetical protein
LAISVVDGRKVLPGAEWFQVLEALLNPVMLRAAIRAAGVSDELIDLHELTPVGSK